MNQWHENSERCESEKVIVKIYRISPHIICNMQMWYVTAM